MSEEKNVVEQQGESQELKRGIKGWQVAFIGLGGVIGSCYFLGLGLCIGDMGPAVFVAFAVVGLIVYGLMIAYAELLVNLPRKGSFVAYTNEFLGDTISTGMGWAFWFNWVCYVPSEAIAVATVLQDLTGSKSSVSYVAFAVGALAALTIINLCAVDIFAKIESGLAITKVCVIILFIVLAFGIWVGLWGSEGFLGATVNFGDADVSFMSQLFPKGAGIVLTSMVVVLVTFQGTEIVGLTAAEAENPDESLPKACKSVTYRIVGLYMVPILLVVLVFPWSLGTDATPIFSDVLKMYNLNGFALIMSAVVLVAAFSCANTGFYGTVRCMFGLSIEGLAPKFLGKLNKSANPKNSVLFTLAFMWIVLIIGLVSQITGALESLYGSLLSMSGFTGTLAWIGIIASQILFRRRLKKRGYDPETCLRAKVKKSQSWIPWFAMIAQFICLVMLAFGEGQLPIFILACSAVVVPMIVRVIAKKTGHVRDINALGNGEKTFDETFPDLTK
ncbi:amino acid permease [Anaerovorax odorimutans]|uniref:Amino acid permease n=1 Tax=Anaerovorax odorimutans TaxID=109327 RepID=A0ABT1RJX1_9FIRM|nr:amino acid permease [Anaerovorax odorimutans]MCQ4635488.1 amino acid permease [Anaerovorax odorimutans]